MKYSVEP